MRGRVSLVFIRSRGGAHRATCSSRTYHFAWDLMSVVAIGMQCTGLIVCAGGVCPSVFFKGLAGVAEDPDVRKKKGCARGAIKKDD